jgi:Flp pilus assembly protein TadG
MRAGPHPGTGERGATVVELALVFPLFAAMILALVHFGLIEASDSSASNGAREGARVGIFEYLDADVPGSESRAAIDTAATGQLSGLVGSPEITVRCRRPAGTQLSTVPCDDNVVLNRDLIEVTVTWSSVSPFGSGARTEQARMVIIGRPDLTEIVPPSTTTTVAQGPP